MKKPNQSTCVLWPVGQVLQYMCALVIHRWQHPYTTTTTTTPSAATNETWGLTAIHINTYQCNINHIMTTEQTPAVLTEQQHHQWWHHSASSHIFKDCNYSLTWMQHVVFNQVRWSCLSGDQPTGRTNRRTELWLLPTGDRRGCCVKLALTDTRPEAAGQASI